MDNVETAHEPISQVSRDQFLALVPPDGASIGNGALRKMLGWEEAEYRAVRDKLVDDGVLRPGHGRGGSIRRAESDSELLAQRRRQFVEGLPQDGSGVSNRTLREKLGWPLEHYEFVRTTLLESGEVAPSRGGGRGGSIRRATPPSVAEPEPVAEPLRRREIELYPDFKAGLAKWAAQQGWTQHEVELIAQQGRRPTGGTWTRPDLVVVGYKTYDYTPGRTRDVATFEVQLADCPIDAVFETAAHSRFATQSYLAIQRSGGKPADSDLSRIESECLRFGLGLLVFTDPKEPSDWRFSVQASRREPDPGLVEDFVRQQLSQATQQKLRQWLH